MASSRKTTKDYFKPAQAISRFLDDAKEEIQSIAIPVTSSGATNIEQAHVQDSSQSSDMFAMAQACCKELQSNLASGALCLEGDPWVKPRMQEQSSAKEQATSTVSETSFQHSIFVWSPEHLLPGFKMACPTCRVATDNSEWTRPRVLHGLTQINFYLTRKYSCFNCGTGKSKAAGARHKPRKTFVADAPDVLEQLPLSLAALHNLVDSGKIICEPTVLDFIRALATKTSWSGIAEALNELKGRSLQACLQPRGAGLDTAAYQDDWDDFELPATYRLSDGWVRNTYVKDGHRRQAGRAAELATEKGDDILMVDWTKDAAARSGGTWLFNAMDSKRRILAFKLTNTSKPKEVEDILGSLAERGASPDVIYVDDECCGSWKDIVGRIWPQCEVRLDPFHAMRRLSETTSSTQHPWHSEFCGKLSNAIYTYDREVRTALESARLRQKLSRHIPRQDLLKHVPKRVENPERIIAAISSLLAEYKSRCHGAAGPLLTIDTENAWKCLRRHVSQGCLCDPSNVNLHESTGKQAVFGGEAFPILRSRRGSSALEGFHTHQKNWLGMLATHGKEAGTLLLEHGVAKWNRKRHRENVADINARGAGTVKRTCC